MTMAFRPLWTKILPGHCRATRIGQSTLLMWRYQQIISTWQSRTPRKGLMSCTCAVLLIQLDCWAAHMLCLYLKVHQLFNKHPPIWPKLKAQPPSLSVLPEQSHYLIFHGALMDQTVMWETFLNQAGSKFSTLDWIRRHFPARWRSHLLTTTQTAVFTSAQQTTPELLSSPMHRWMYGVSEPMRFRMDNIFLHSNILTKQKTLLFEKNTCRGGNELCIMRQLDISFKSQPHGISLYIVTGQNQFFTVSHNFNVFLLQWRLASPAVACSW